MEPNELIDAFCAAYRPHVAVRLGRLGAGDVAGVEDAISNGEVWLRDQLSALAAQPFGDQRRGPLELFQEAMSHPTATLVDAKVHPVDRDEVAVAALPGDIFGLAPASSRELGEAAWAAHLAWGAAKAAEMSRPVPPAFGVYTSNLMDRSKFETMSQGWRVITWRTLDEIDTVPSVAFVDLQTSLSDDAIVRLSAAGAKVYAFGPHVDDVAMVRARTLGATDAMARSVFFRRFPELLPAIV